ncbi:Cytochrome c oxidase subunit 6, mitochondrial [Golovinomyces cichoracearum]|uniref:Cytochrome c oxidase subunit 6, mitochondrial n=1 Tax=Golovinomyces cichoracearum TaxID=62708 RepID=A0A420J941_9PEZI|nr:Cytochrome c oxidase subunit 6, mitochondrial [Golovinomyces cichoracearum]
MSSPSTLRIAARAFPSNGFRKTRAVNSLTAGIISSGLLRNFSTTSFRLSDKEETFEEFTARFEKEFEKVTDVFDLQRNLNNAFAYDLVPSPTVITAALRAARRVNDFPTAVRIFEGIKAKVENKGQYEQYLEELKPLREELSIPLKEDMYPEKE